MEVKVAGNKKKSPKKETLTNNVSPKHTKNTSTSPKLVSVLNKHKHLLKMDIIKRRDQLEAELLSSYKVRLSLFAEIKNKKCIF